jgi:hypothetical protein
VALDLINIRARKSSLICVAGFIIDLSLTMDILFYLARGGKPLTIRLINKALLTYQGRKDGVHRALQSWITRQESIFDHFKPKLALEEMERIIFENCVKPTEGATMAGDYQRDEEWISREKLANASGIGDNAL